MEVILREHVDNLGRRGDLVKVADGYARNYLLPRKMALLAEEQKVAQAVADRLASVEGEISRKTGETDALFGSVTNADIAEALAAKGFDVDRRTIQLHDPIKRLGEFEVPVKLHRDVTVTLKVKVVAEAKA